MTSPPRTRTQIETAKKKGDIRGWFTKMPRGRPPKRKDAPVPAESVAEVQVAPKPAKRRKLENWSAPEKFLVLKAAVHGDQSRDLLALSSIQVPRSTLQRQKEKCATAGMEHGVTLQEVSSDMVCPRPRSLLKPADWDLLSEVAVYRDLQNNGMKRAKAITMVMELSQCGNRKTATNHFEYLVRVKKRLSSSSTMEPRSRASPQ